MGKPTPDLPAIEKCKKEFMDAFIRHAFKGGSSVQLCVGIIECLKFEAFQTRGFSFQMKGLIITTEPYYQETKLLIKRWMAEGDFDNIGVITVLEYLKLEMLCFGYLE